MWGAKHYTCHKCGWKTDFVSDDELKVQFHLHRAVCTERDGGQTTMKEIEGSGSFFGKAIAWAFIALTAAIFISRLL